MTSADHYRALAAQCDAKAEQDGDWKIRAEWEHMARSYRRLAQQADRNSQTDVTYETPPQRPDTIEPDQRQQPERDP